MAPAHLGGLLVVLYAYFMNIGQVLGSLVDNYIKDRLDKTSYQIPIAYLCIVPFFLSIGLFFILESPRWLLHKGKAQHARSSLEVLRANSVSPGYMDAEWMEIMRGVEEEKSVSNSADVFEMFRGEKFLSNIMTSTAYCTVQFLHEKEHTLTAVRSQPPAHHSLLRCYRQHELFRMLVYYRLPDLLLYYRWHHQIFSVYHYEHVPWVSRRVLWYVWYSASRWSARCLRDRLHGMWFLFSLHGH